MALFQWVPDSPSGFRDDGDWCSLCRKRLQGAADAGGTLDAAGHGTITTQIAPAGPFFYAEDYHQQYLAKNPGGYCGLDGTGVTCPIGIGASA